MKMRQTIFSRETALHHIRTLLSCILIYAVCILIFPESSQAYDQQWDGGHVTTTPDSPPPSTPPGPDTGGNGDGDGDDEGNDDGGDDSDDPSDDDPSNGDDPDNQDEPGDDPSDDPDDPQNDDEGEDEEEDKDDDCKPDCNNTCKPDAKKSPVYVKSGNLELSFKDIDIPGIGPDLSAIRTYNSHEKYTGPFGHNWTFNFTVRLIKTTSSQGDFVIIRGAKGQRSRFMRNDDGSYTPTSSSSTDILSENADGSFILNCPSCSRNFFKPAYSFNSNGYLTEIRDNNDNSLNFTYNQESKPATITSSATGRSLTFAYNSKGFISTITDSSSRTWSYLYSDNDDLVQVTDPLDFTIKYEYDDAHKLLLVIDKNGNYRHVMTYDSQGRIASYGRGSEIYTYTYNTGYTTKTDPLGNAFQYYYDDNGNVTKTILPDGTEIVTEIDQNINPTQKIDGNGNAWQYTYNENGQILTETDPLGNVTSYTYNDLFRKIATKTDARGAIWSYQYDARGNLIQETNPLGCSIQFTYNEAGQFLTRTDAANNTWTYSYDAIGNLLSETDPAGNAETYNYDGLGRRLSKTDRRGNRWTYSYDLLGRLLTVTDPLDRTTQYSYDAAGNRLSETDRNGNTTRYEYDTYNRRTKKIDQQGNTTGYSYDVKGQLLTVTDPLGNASSRTYDGRGLILTETNALDETITYEYDASGNRTSKTDGRNNTWTYAYDGNDNLIFETNPLGQTKHYYYDEVGNMVKTVDPEGKTALFIYDLGGNKTQAVSKIGDQTTAPDSDDVVFSFTYDCLGRRISETDPLGATTTYAYDFAGKTTLITNDLGETKQYTYDVNGNKLSYTSTTGNVITYTYNKLNKVVTVGDTTGLFETYEYDGEGNKTKTTKVNGDTESITYNHFNKPATVTDGAGNTTTYSYDGLGKVVQVVDRLSQTTTNSYDELGRLTHTTDPLGNSSAIEYDASGNVVLMRDSNNQETTYTYNEANQLTQVTYADGTSKAVNYDSAGKIASKTDQNGALVTYTRDDLGRIVQRDYPDGSSYSYTYDKLGRTTSGTNAYGTVNFTFDAVGRITAINQNGVSITYAHDVSARTRTINYPGGKQYREHFTLRDKISAIEDLASGTNVVSYGYDTIGRPVSKEFGNGLTSSFTYNDISRIDGISLEDSGGTAIQGLDYTFDAEGNSLSKANTIQATQSEQYTYDNAQRLVNFKRGQLDAGNQIPSPLAQTAYTLDGVGNWTAVTRNSTTENRTVNAVNQYSSVNGTSFVYDNNGNLLDDGVHLYTYNFENQLIEVKDKASNTVLVSYVVDAFNRRVQKIAGGVTTDYIYDDSRIIEEQVNTLTKAHYVYGNRLDEVVLMHRTQDLYFQTDVLGSTLALLNSSGAIVESYLYDPYGSASIFNGSGSALASSAYSNPYLFTGRRLDTETGIYYYRSRSYHPGLGRFLSMDPKGYIDGMNLYAYALSNPLRFVDPRGTSVSECESDSFSIEASMVKKYLPGFLSKYIGDMTVGGYYKKCTSCCGEGTKHAGEYVVDKELNFNIAWSGDSGFISTPWGIGWDIDTWIFSTKGFIGLVARVYWGINGAAFGATDNCDETIKGGGCVTGTVGVEALFGLSEADKDSGLIKAYVSGGVSGNVNLCLLGHGGSFKVETSLYLSGAIKGTAGIWKFTYEKSFYEVNVTAGPWVIYQI